MNEKKTVQAQSKTLWLAGSGAIQKWIAIMIAAALLSVSGTATAADKDRKFESTNNGSVIFIDVEANDPWQPDGFSKPLSVHAKFVDQEQKPVIDGRADDPAWSGAENATVPLSWGGVPEATVKAVYTSEEIFLLVSWPDASKDDQHHPWLWDAEQGRYMEGPQVEDALLVSIEGGCDWNPSLLSGTEYDFDGWLWLAARSDPLGQAIDVDGNVRTGAPRNYLVKYKSRYTEASWDIKFYDRRKDIQNKSWQELDRLYKSTQPKPEVYVSYRADGSPTPEFTKLMTPPPLSDVNDNPPPLVAQHHPIKLTGDAGDVAAKGHWADGRWTVEYRRSLTTPTRTASDSLIERISQFSLHIFDQTERLDEASESGRIWLEFEQPVDGPAVAGTTTH
jgi:hypothetical protein